MLTADSLIHVFAVMELKRNLELEQLIYAVTIYGRIHCAKWLMLYVIIKSITAVAAGSTVSLNVFFSPKIKQQCTSLTRDISNLILVNAI